MVEKGLIDNSLSEHEIKEFIEYKKTKSVRSYGGSEVPVEDIDQPHIRETELMTEPNVSKGDGKRSKGNKSDTRKSTERVTNREKCKTDGHKTTPKKGKPIPSSVLESNSDVTVYSRAVKLNIPPDSGELVIKESGLDDGDLDTTINMLLDNTRNQIDGGRKVSSSSEELMDTSDETAMEISNESESFVADRPGPSRMEIETEEAAADLIKDAEGRRGTMYEVSGKVGRFNTSQIDEDYQMLDTHVDEAMRKKIQRFEFIELGRLLPRNRGSDDDHQRLEIINRNGMSYLSPVSDRETNNIHSYAKWEQAFRIYTNIVTTKFPNKATELLQYSHTIQTASSAYSWENVQAYDKEFRRHIARHPYRSWRVILQQAWTMLLKDRV